MTKNELETKIIAAQQAYYAGTPVMSDADFDTLWDTLTNLYPDSTVLKNVGSDLGESNGFKKVTHNIIMGSQSKANTVEEMDSFFKRNYGKMIAQYKMDGSSVVLDYIDGKLIRCVSRGDGTVGVDYTANTIKMNGVVAQLKEKFTGSVRGEVLLSKTNKDKYFPEMANCRNAATGTWHTLDGAGCDKLDVIVYDAQYLDKTQSFGTQTTLQTFLKDNGFNVAPYVEFELVNGRKAVEHLNKVWKTLDGYDFDIDGIVFKLDEIDMNDITTNYRPKTQIALKPARTVVKTILKDIEWECVNGSFTPVAILEPVSLLGATITRASLCNVSLLEELGIEIGDEVEIARCGEIIPKVLRNVRTGKIAKGYEETFNN